MLRNRAADDKHSILPNDIWLGDRSGSSNSTVFSREVLISGWLAVGDTRRGGYIGAYLFLQPCAHFSSFFAMADES